MGRQRERSRSGQKPVGTGEQAAATESEDEPGMQALEGIHDHHQRHSCGAERREHELRLTHHPIDVAPASV